MGQKLGGVAQRPQPDRREGGEGALPRRGQRERFVLLGPPGIRGLLKTVPAEAAQPFEGPGPRHQPAFVQRGPGHRAQHLAQGVVVQIPRRGPDPLPHGFQVEGRRFHQERWRDRGAGEGVAHHLQHPPGHGADVLEQALELRRTAGLKERGQGAQRLDPDRACVQPPEEADNPPAWRHPQPGQQSRSALVQEAPDLFVGGRQLLGDGSRDERAQCGVHLEQRCRLGERVEEPEDGELAARMEAPGRPQHVRRHHVVGQPVRGRAPSDPPALARSICRRRVQPHPVLRREPARGITNPRLGPRPEPQDSDLRLLANGLRFARRTGEPRGGHARPGGGVSRLVQGLLRRSHVRRIDRDRHSDSSGIGTERAAAATRLIVMGTSAVTRSRHSGR